MVYINEWNINIIFYELRRNKGIIKLDKETADKHWIGNSGYE